MKKHKVAALVIGLASSLLGLSAQGQMGIQESHTKQLADFSGSFNNGTHIEKRWGGIWLKKVVQGKELHREIRFGIGRITGNVKADGNAYSIRLPEQEVSNFQHAILRILDAANRNRNYDAELRTIQFNNPGLSAIYREENTGKFSVTLAITASGIERQIVIDSITDLQALSDGLVIASPPPIKLRNVPRGVMLSLAGNSLRNIPQTGTFEYDVVFDTQKHYYLIKYNDGISKRLVLIPKMVQEWKEETGGAQVQYSSLPSLSTEGNVYIGQTLQAVRTRLGRPSSEDAFKVKGQEENRLFYQYFGGRLDGWSYIAWYSFQRGRLSEISLSVYYGPQVPG